MKNFQFYNPRKSAELTLDPLFYDFLEENYNKSIKEVVIQEEYSELHLDVASFSGMNDVDDNDSFSESEKKMSDTLNLIVESAASSDLDLIILNRG